MIEKKNPLYNPEQIVGERAPLYLLQREGAAAELRKPYETHPYDMVTAEPIERGIVKITLVPITKNEGVIQKEDGVRTLLISERTHADDRGMPFVITASGYEYDGLVDVYSWKDRQDPPTPSLTAREEDSRALVRKLDLVEAVSDLPAAIRRQKERFGGIPPKEISADLGIAVYEGVLTVTRR